MLCFVSFLSFMPSSVFCLFIHCFYSSQISCFSFLLSFLFLSSDLFLFLFLSILSYHSAVFTSFSVCNPSPPSPPLLFSSTGYNLQCVCVCVCVCVCLCVSLSPSLSFRPSEPHVLSYYSLIISEAGANPQHSPTHIFFPDFQVCIQTFQLFMFSLSSWKSGVLWEKQTWNLFWSFCSY